MIQDIGEHSFDNSYRICEPGGDARLVICDGDALLLRDGCELAEFPRAADAPEGAALRYLFSIDGDPYFLADGPLELQGFSLRTLREVRSAAPAEAVLAAAVGVQLARWYRENRFCGACGFAMEHAPSSREMVCPACGRIVYPKIAPGVIVGVVDRATESIVLTVYGDRPAVGPALVAGFTEAGESLEQTVAREVCEEVGLAVRNLRFYASQPWPFSDSLLAGFFCEVDGSREIAVDGRELKRAEWTRREDVPTRADDRVSLTGEMMKLFRERGADVLDPDVRWEGAR